MQLETIYQWEVGTEKLIYLNYPPKKGFVLDPIHFFVTSGGHFLSSIWLTCGIRDAIWLRFLVMAGRDGVETALLGPLGGYSEGVIVRMPSHLPYGYTHEQSYNKKRSQPLTRLTCEIQSDAPKKFRTFPHQTTHLNCTVTTYVTHNLNPGIEAA